MSICHGREGPDQERGAEADPSKQLRPLGHPPSNSDKRRFNGSPANSMAQVGHDTYCTSQAGGNPFAFPVLHQSGSHKRGPFQVQKTVLGADDGGHRRALLERLLFSPAHFHAVWTSGFGGQDDLPPTAGLAGVREPAPGRGKPAGGAGSIALEAVASRYKLADAPTGAPALFF